MPVTTRKKAWSRPAALSAAFLLCVSLVQAGERPGPSDRSRESGRSTYWRQRVTHFRSLPDTKGEIIFLGDSITDGCNWTELFADIRVKNRGISGDVTDGVLERLDEVLSSRPSKVFLMIGVNDLAAGKSLEEIAGNIVRIVKSMHRRSPETEVFLQSVLPVNGDFEMFPRHTGRSEDIPLLNRALKRAAEELSCTYVDLYSLFATDGGKLNPEYTNDGLHLTGAGYLAWKKAVSRYIERR